MFCCPFEAVLGLPFSQCRCASAAVQSMCHGSLAEMAVLGAFRCTFWECPSEVARDLVALATDFLQDKVDMFVRAAQLT